MTYLVLCKIQELFLDYFFIVFLYIVSNLYVSIPCLKEALLFKIGRSRVGILMITQ